MKQVDKIFYAAKTHTAGGRQSGASLSSDGQMDHRLSTPGAARRGVRLMSLVRLVALGVAFAVAPATCRVSVAAGLQAKPGPETWAAAFALQTAAFAVPAGKLSGAQSSLLAAPQWLNTQPLLPKDLRGKVVLVNFWTYSCINSLRALPYVRAWAQKYKDRGLVVIGVHTPEFAFEKDVTNIREATASLGVDYPVAIDSDYAIWRALGNQGWPAFYFIGADGRVRHHELGEGNYDESERLIQKLLSEADGAPVGGEIMAIAGTGPQAAGDDADLRSEETYVGYDQATHFASPGGIRQDAQAVYRSPSGLPLNRWSLDGAWTVGGEFATLNAPSGSIAYRFHARDLHAVLAPASRGQTIRFRITIDGAAPGQDHGTDVDAEGWGSVREPRMYQLVRQQGAVADRTFAIEFFGPDVRAYVFTFG